MIIKTEINDWSKQNHDGHVVLQNVMPSQINPPKYKKYLKLSRPSCNINSNACAWINARKHNVLYDTLTLKKDFREGVSVNCAAQCFIHSVYEISTFITTGSVSTQLPVLQTLIQCKQQMALHDFL